MTDAKASKSIIALDLVRGLAALEVMLCHVRGGNWVEFGALPAGQQNIATSVFFLLTRLGHEAVLIFFVLSGFLIGGNLIERVQSGRFNIADYAVDRVTRILIPLAPACIFTAAINHFAFDDTGHFGQLLGNMTGLNGIFVDTLMNNSPLWSLAYEIWFYVLAGSLALVLSSEGTLLAFVVFAGAVFVFATLDAHYLLIWGMGALTARIVDQPNAKRLVPLGLILTIVGFVLYQLASGSKSFNSQFLVSPAIAEAVLCSGFCLCIPWLCGAEVNANLQVVHSPARLLSHISFSLYLVHYPLNAYLSMLFPKAAQIDVASCMIMVVKLGLCGMLGGGFWLLFEKSSFKLRKYLKTDLLMLRLEKA